MQSPAEDRQGKSLDYRTVRPHEFNEVSATQFLDDRSRVYPYMGTDPNYVFYMDHVKINVLKLLEHNVRENITLLDIGCGGGALVKHVNSCFDGKIKAYGITAHAYGYDDEKEAERDNIYIGDAQDILSIPCVNNKKFDYIVSNLTFCHLRDSASALVQAYELLAPGGLMLINHFTIHIHELSEIISKKKALYHYLKDNGYLAEISGIGFSYAGFNTGPLTIIIRKTHSHLILPIQYHRLVESEFSEYKGSKKIFFSALPELLLYSQQNEHEKNSSENTEEFHKRLNQDLTKLFSNLKYQVMTMKHQQEELLNLVGTIPGYDNYRDNCLHNSTVEALYYEVLALNPLNRLPLLFAMKQFQELDDKAKLICIKLIAHEDRLRNYLAPQRVRQLENLDIPAACFENTFEIVPLSIPLLTTFKTARTSFGLSEPPAATAEVRSTESSYDFFNK